ncbi:cell division initiation protein, partial [Streptomyces sp. TRM76130]|nr:cell division initiation protein [Streptomyces sp. TRM76130]
YGYAQQQPDPYGGYPQQPYAGQHDPYGYQQADPYDPASGYAPAGDAPFQGYEAQQQGYLPQQHSAYEERQPGYDQPQQPAQALDETSLFDTSMISAEQLRAYEQGRGL